MGRGDGGIANRFQKNRQSGSKIRRPVWSGPPLVSPEPTGQSGLRTSFFWCFHSDLPNAISDDLSREIEFLIPLALAQESASQQSRQTWPRSFCSWYRANCFNSPLDISALAWADERLQNDLAEIDPAEIRRDLTRELDFCLIETIRR